MNSILEKLTDFTADQFAELVTEHASVQRTNRAQFTEARTALTRLPEFAEQSVSAGQPIVYRMDVVGFFGGRDKALAAARTAVVAETLRDQITEEQFSVLTATFNTVAAVAA